MMVCYLQIHLYYTEYDLKWKVDCELADQLRKRCLNYQKRREKENKKKWVIISLGYYYICNNYRTNIGIGPLGF